MTRAGRTIGIAFSSLLVLISRSLFFLHAVILAWRVTDVTGPAYWAVGFVLVFAILEIAYVLIKRKAKEWTWFSIPVALYLICVVPGIWLLRLNQVAAFRTRIGAISDCKNLADSLQDTSSDNATMGLSSQFGIDIGAYIPLNLDSKTWTELLDQSLIFVLIVTRWIAPFGRVSHRKLSELLFVYVGLGSDIVELFVLFDEPCVLVRDDLVYWILGVWTLSLTQFMLPLTGAIAHADPSRVDKTPGRCRDCMRNEAWTVAAVVFLQDGPFLSIRLYLMIVVELYANYSLAFFTVKNILVVLLQFYRFIVLLACVDSTTGQSIRRRGNRPPRSDKTEGGHDTGYVDSGQVSMEMEPEQDVVEENSDPLDESENEDDKATKDDIESNNRADTRENGHYNTAFIHEDDTSNTV